LHKRRRRRQHATGAEPRAERPDAIPFDILMGYRSGSNAPRQVMAAAEPKPKSETGKLTRRGRYQWRTGAFLAMEGAQIGAGAVSVGQGSHLGTLPPRNPVCSTTRLKSGHPYVSTLDPTLVAVLVDFRLSRAGKLIGAVGCSGGTGDRTLSSQGRR